MLSVGALPSFTVTLILSPSFTLARSTSKSTGTSSSTTVTSETEKPPNPETLRLYDPLRASMSWGAQILTSCWMYQLLESNSSVF